MRVDLFNFELPDYLIALRPARPRDSARLLHAPRDGAFEDLIVCDAPSLFRAGDLLVFNDTRVIPAALRAIRPGRDALSGNVAVSLNLIERVSIDAWRALAKPGKRLKPGDTLQFVQSSPPPAGEGAGGGGRSDLDQTPPSAHTPSLPSLQGGRASLIATMTDKTEDGALTLRFDRGGAALDEAIAQIGAAPLPPYIAARREPDADDARDYQTIYAAKDGAVAAPTAGLHFTNDLFARFDAIGAERAHVTLHVGAGTFLPVKADDTEAHVMHSEWREIPAATAEAVNRAKAEGRRVIAIGTTALRTLESSANEDGSVRAEAGPTDIFITPGYRFKVVDGLWTNFHLPRSTLFMLVSAFAGLERMKAAYAHAIANQYRFYSYGDASLLWRA